MGNLNVRGQAGIERCDDYAISNHRSERGGYRKSSVYARGQIVLRENRCVLR